MHPTSGLEGPGSACLQSVSQDIVHPQLQEYEAGLAGVLETPLVSVEKRTKLKNLSS